MTQRQLDALSALLLRVQENRRAPRKGRSAAAVSPVAAAPAPSRVEPAGFDDFSDRTPAPPPPPPPRRPGADRRATPLEMAVAGELEQQLAAASEARAIASPAATAANREALAAMVDPRTEPRAEVQRVDARRDAPVSETRREAPVAAPRAARPAPAPAPAPEPITDVQARQPLDPDQIEPLIIEPDPPREVVRPIAQVVSKHAPAVDATFGAMLKRSLSLRPH